MFNTITAIVISGGISRRFWPLGDKNTVPILGKPLLVYRLGQLKKLGFKHIIIITHKSNTGHIRNIVGNLCLERYEIIEQIYPEGMAGAVKSIGTKYRNLNDLLITSPTDVFEDRLFSDLHNILKKQKPDAVIAGKKIDSYFPGGYLSVDNNGNILQIIEKPIPVRDRCGIVNLVFHYFREGGNLFRYLEQENSGGDDVYEKAVSKMINNGMKCKLLPYAGYWGYLKYPWHLLDVNQYFLSGIRKKDIKTKHIASTAVIKGFAVIEDGVKIQDHAVIIGPVFIGKGSIIGNNSFIRQSSIGSDCVVGFASEIARSWIADNCWFHNNYIGDSLIGEGVAMGAGAVTANYRLDQTEVYSKVSGAKMPTGKVKLGTVTGKYSRIGVNASIMPGVKIGQYSIIGSGVVLDRDIADKMFCRMENRLKVSVNKILPKK